MSMPPNMQDSSRYVVLTREKPCCSICAKDITSPFVVNDVLNQAESMGLTFVWMYIYNPTGCVGSGNLCPTQKLVMIFERK